MRIETSNAESLWTLFLCTSSNAGKQSAKRQLETQNSRSIRQLQALKLPSPHATIKPPNPPYLATAWVGDKRPRHYPPEEYCIKPRVLSNSRAVRTCHGSGKLSCLSRVVLHTFASLSHLSHLKVFGTFLLYSIRTSDLHSRPDQHFSMAPFKPPKPNPALFTNEHHEIFMGESPELDPKPHECIVHVRCNGICG